MAVRRGKNVKNNFITIAKMQTKILFFFGKKSDMGHARVVTCLACMPEPVSCMCRVPLTQAHTALGCHGLSHALAVYYWARPGLPNLIDTLTCR